MDDKPTLRRRVRQARALIDPQALQARSARICEHVLAMPLWQRAETVACFVSMGHEVQTAALLGSGKRIALPRVERPGAPLRFFEAGGPLVRSAFGVLEPGPDAVQVPIEAIDLVLLPGLAVDRAGRRLGYGGGFYDRTLAHSTAPRVMLVLADMVFDEVPADAHDQRVHAFVTEHGLTPCRADAAG